MLKIEFSNRIETLRDAVVDAVGAVPASPFSAQQIIVPSTAMRRYLTLGIAERHGICANVDFVYLAAWLWQQIARVVRTVAVESPFAASALQWRVHQLLGQPEWLRFPRLGHYLKEPNDLKRFELAGEVAALFEQYITYRQDWTTGWLAGGGIRMAGAAAAQIEDEAWQAELFRHVSAQLGAAPEHPASPFFRHLEAAGSSGAEPDLPSAVQVFCLAAVPPLYLAMLTGLARWVDVTLYVLNPCREYWFDIVDRKRLRALALRGADAHHETGNRLLASWGRQTKAHIELLVGGAEDAPLNDAGFDERFPATLLGRLQQSIFTLSELAPASVPPCATDRSIEVHVCHSLTRQLEVLQDQLLALFAGPAPPRPDEILIVMPDLEAAAPLIEAVFGHVPEERRLPFAITGRGRSTQNGAARALLALLALVPSRFPASALVDLLQQPLVARRVGIGAAELPVVEEWLHASGMRWGIDAQHRHELGLPGDQRFTVSDGLDRLFLGYALPQRVTLPTFERLPAGNAEGSQAEILGAFADFVEKLLALRAALRAPRLPEAWLDALLAVLESCLAPQGDDVEDLAEVRAVLRELYADMRRGGITTPVSLGVVRASLESLLDDPARGGVPTGSITFSSMSSLRNLPFRFIGIIGLDDGAFPAAVRPREFDLMAAMPRAGDRQRRLDDRNLFLDLVLAARERLYLSYTGRSIRDDSERPPSVLVAELLDVLLPALAGAPGDSPTKVLEKARQQLIVVHALQAFDESYFREKDPRRRSYDRELCAALRHRAEERTRTAAATATGTGTGTASLQAASPEHAAVAMQAQAPSAGSAGGDEDDEAGSDRDVVRFFTGKLTTPGPEWRRVSLDLLLQFFRNPCKFLLSQRLGISQYDVLDGVSDEEPFVPDSAARRALAERLLPQALEGLGMPELRRLAQAGLEYPTGTFGSTALQDELNVLQRFARTVRAATVTPRLPPFEVELPFELEGEDWRLTTVLTERRASGLVLWRYEDIRAGDYLTAWLNHLVSAAASAVPTESLSIARDGTFRLTDCRDARARLKQLLLLYRRGLSEPVHFFPRSAWAYLGDNGNRNLTKARKAWVTTDYVRGEDRHPAYRLALRGVADPLDADFQDCAETVFGAAIAHLQQVSP